MTLFGEAARETLAWVSRGVCLHQQTLMEGVVQ
jgi:hypothetical protein